MEEETVEILEVATSIELEDLKNPITGEYYAPIPQNPAYRDERMQNAVKYLERQTYLEEHGASEQEFEAAWPSIWAELQEPPDGAVPERTFAVLDTGLMSDHPLIRDRIEESIDFTGEGTEDYNGHGTTCALLLHDGTTKPPVPRLALSPRFINVKVLGSNGRGTPGNLIKGLRWLTLFKEERGLADDKLTANLSIGVYSRKWGTFQCRGDCRVCEAAIDAAKAGIRVFAAAGNRAGVTSCPARAGVLGKHKRIAAVAASDYSNSGIGTLTLPGNVVFRGLD